MIMNPIASGIELGTVFGAAPLCVAGIGRGLAARSMR
jgi:hypothetical protein